MEADFIKLGTAPDYVMKKSGTILSHIASVKIHHEVTSRTESRQISNRSFQVMKRELEQVMRSRLEVRSAKCDFELDHQGEFEITGSGVVILAKYNLNPKLTTEDRKLLASEFARFLNELFSFTK